MRHVTVLRGGRVVGTTTPRATDRAGLANMMVGRSVVLQVEKGEAHPADVVLDIAGLEVDDDRGHRAVNGLDLQVRAGEIVGVAGVEGNGQRELVEALCGMRPPKGGRCSLQDARHHQPEGARHQPPGRVAHPRGPREARLRRPPTRSPATSCSSASTSPRSRRGILRDFDAVHDNAAELVERFDVRPRNIHNPMNALSGGNKQKVIVARELSQGAQLVVAAQPTRGVDVGSIEFIHRQLVDQRDAGVAVLLVSAELDEIQSLSDRIAVIYEGRIQAVMPVAEADARAHRAADGRRPRGPRRLTSGTTPAAPEALRAAGHP